MALGKNIQTGRFDAAQTPVMKVVRKPRFVDNAVRHGEYSKKQAGFTVSKPVSSDFLPTHDRRYKLEEEEDTVRLFHNPSDGHKYIGAVYTDGDKVTTSSALPPLFVGSDSANQSLAPSSIEPSPKGTRYRIENLKGKELNQIGFTDRAIHIAQKVGVGLRSSDLAIRAAKASTSSLNGVVAPNPSSTFVAQDFYGTDAVAAMRFLNKHDSYNARGDSFGNLIYSHQKKHGREYLITQTMVTGGSVKDMNENVPNRVVVRGKPRANNDLNVVQVDDFGPQTAGVNEVPGGIVAPTAITKSSARMIGRRMLSMAKRSTGSERLRDVIHSSHIQPGDVISYDTVTGSQRKVVLSSRHELSKRKSELQINSAEATLEDVIQRFQEVDIGSTSEEAMERNRQFSTEEFATSFGFDIKVTWRVEVRKLADHTEGMGLGLGDYDTIHGGRHFKSTGVLINNGAGYPIGTTVYTTDGTDATTVFTVGDFVYRSNGNKLGEISARTVTSVTIIIGAPDLVLDNEELLLLSVDSLPEALNNHLKIKMNKTDYSSRRRG